MKDNAWFVGFAPRENPEIVAVALYEHGGHGQYAAAIVRDVIKAYFDKKQRLTQLRDGQLKLQAAFGLGVPAGQMPGFKGGGAAAGAQRPGAANPTPVVVTGAVMEAEAPAPGHSPANH